MKKHTKPEQEDRGRNDSLTELIRTGAQKLIAQALKAEVAELLAIGFSYLSYQSLSM